MKLVIAGSRDLYAMDILQNAIVHFGLATKIEEIVHGGCRGVDSSAGKLAEMTGIRCKVFTPLWATHGKSAGPKRNKQMAEYGDALLLVWVGDSTKSPGSYSMKHEMLKLCKPVYEVVLAKYNG